VPAARGSAVDITNRIAGKVTTSRAPKDRVSMRLTSELILAEICDRLIGRSGDRRSVIGSSAIARSMCDQAILRSHMDHPIARSSITD
jgi:hypothetical protein